MRFRNIDHLELHDRVTHLYLQHNAIEKIENLEDLTRLRFLALFGNRISAVEGLDQLASLAFLDLSDNNIAELNVSALPKSLTALRLRGNPCADRPGYRQAVAAALPALRTLDDEPVRRDEDAAAEGDA
jgi:protein TilB